MFLDKTLKTIKLRLYPNEEQEMLFNQHFGNVRFVRNHLIMFEQIYYGMTRKFANKKVLAKLLPQLKKEFPFLKYSDKFALEVAMEKLIITYQQFFKGNGGLPSFSKRSFNQSYTTKMTNNNLHFVSDCYFKLPKFKEPFKVSKCHVPHQRIRQATIIRRSTGKYFLVLTVDAPSKQFEKTNATVGIDAGLSYNQILSDYLDKSLIDGLKAKALHFDDLESKLKEWQRKYARRKDLAKQREAEELNYQKKFNGTDNVVPWQYRHNVVEARHRVARLYEKISNIRYDFLQQLTTKIVKKFDVISIEKLNVKSMMQNHSNAHAIANQGWAMFRQMLIYKCVWYGKELRLVNPVYTTQKCSNCKYICNRHDGTHIERDVKEWTCPKCHQWHDRDINAATNMKFAKAIKIFNSQTGLEGMEVE